MRSPAGNRNVLLYRITPDADACISLLPAAYSDSVGEQLGPPVPELDLEVEVVDAEALDGVERDQREALVLPEHALVDGLARRARPCHRRPAGRRAACPRRA